MTSAVSTAPLPSARRATVVHAATRWERLAALLSWAMLVWQAILPWTAARFITQDGPSHLYNALIARSLWLDSHSPFAGIYEIQTNVLPNWGCTPLLALTAMLFGVAHAEQALMTLLVLAGYCCFSYALRALPHNRIAWSPLANCLITSYFLFRGYYNLYLGMALLLLAIGYYLRHATEFTMRRALTLAALLVALFFVHIVPAGLAVIAISLLFGWVMLLAPLISTKSWRERTVIVRQLRMPAAHLFSALIPVSLLLATFVLNVDAGHAPSEAAEAWHSFPMHTFVISANRIGRLDLLHPALLAYIVCALFLLRRREWLTARGGLVLVGAVLFLMYLFVPNNGFGGGDAKVRFAWGVFLVGGLVASSASRLRRIHTALGLYACLILAGGLVTAQGVNSRASRLAGVYLRAFDAVPANSTFIRLKYPTPKARHQYDIPNDAPSDLFYHLDSFAAASRHALNLSDYEAPSGVFPVVFSQNLPGHIQSYLWGLESPHADTLTQFKELLEHSPVKIGYVAVVGETSAPNSGDLKSALALLEANGARIISTAGDEPFLRIYRTAVP